MKIEIENCNYEIIKDYNKAFNLDDLVNRYTSYFEDYDYILGDYAYGKLRLKGFNNKENPNFNSINDYAKVEEYRKTNCAYGCKYFILKKNNKKIVDGK